MKKNGKITAKKRIVAVTVLVITSLLASGCNGGTNDVSDTKSSDNTNNVGSNTDVLSSNNESNDGNGDKAVIMGYKAESLTINDGENAINDITNVKIYDGNMYYMAYQLPDYPPEYYEDMKRLEAEEEGTAANSENKEDADDTVTDSEKKKETADTGTVDDSTEKKSNKKSDSDDLLGDVDKIFGTEEKNDNDNKEKENRDDTEAKTYDDLFKKYSDYEPKKILCSFNINTKEKKTLFTLDMKDGQNYDDYLITEKGNFLFFTEKNAFDEASNSWFNHYTLEEYGKDGSIYNSADITKDINSGNNASGEDDYIEMVKMINENRIVIKKNNNILVFNSKGKLMGTLKLDRFVDSFAFDSDGNLVMYCMGEAESGFFKADLTSFKLDDKVKGIYDAEDYAGYKLIDGGNGHSLYLMDSVSLYSFDYESSEKHELFKFMDVGLISNYIDTIIPADDGKVYYSSHDPETGSMDIGIISECEVAENKQVITLMAIMVDDIMQKKIINYNRADNRYKINLVTFENEEHPLTSMNNQIIAGNIPDILDIVNIDVKNILAKGILEDMTPYVNGDDKVNEDYFTDGYLDAVKTDGKIYYLGDSFSIKTLVGKASDLEKYKDGWSVKDVIEYYKGKPAGTRLFLSNTKEEVFDQLVLNDIDSYIDWNAGKVSFDGADFKEVLEFCNSFQAEQEGDGELKKDDFKNGKILLNNDYIHSTEELQVADQLYGGDYEYIGYPDGTGGTNYIAPNHAYGICSGTGDKDAAWEIIKMLISEAPGQSTYIDLGIPAVKDSFAEFIKRETTTEKYKDRYGNEVLPRNLSYSYENLEMKLGPAEDEEVERLKELIKNSKGIGSGSSTVSDIIHECVSPYFAGKRTLEDTVKIMQDRMSKYVSENA